MSVRDRTGLLRRARASDLVRGTVANSTARILAIAGLTLATVVVARVGGASAVGGYALLRILPGLAGVLSVGGLPGAEAYFLARPRRGTPRLWPTLMLLLVAGAAGGTVAWAAASPLLHHVFFPRQSLLVVAAAGLTVGTQLFLSCGKNALQGLEDTRGSDTVIALEELAFLPCYGLSLAVGVGGDGALVVGLGLADVVVALYAWRRVARRLAWRRLGFSPEPAGFLGRPDRRLLREVLGYGLRGQAGGLMTLLNLRLDFAVLGAMAGPAVLGIYAVASKYSELLRLPGTALTWVCYPRMAGLSASEAGRRARRAVLPGLVGIAVLAVPLAALTSPVMTLLYGHRFHAAVEPALVLLAGMPLAGASGVASGYLYGRGRPGLNSVATAVGLVVTVALDLMLIPRFGATGAAVASCAAYLTGDGLLVLLLFRLTATRSRAVSSVGDPAEVRS